MIDMQIRLDMEEKRPYNKPIGRRQQPAGVRRSCAEESRACFSFFLLFIEKGVLRGVLSFLAGWTHGDGIPVRCKRQLYICQAGNAGKARKSVPGAGA